MRFGMGCEAQTTAIAWLLRGFATTQTARSRAQLNQPLTHDAYFHTVLGMLDIASPYYQRPLDAMAGCRAS